MRNKCGINGELTAPAFRKGYAAWNNYWENFWKRKYDIRWSVPGTEYRPAKSVVDHTMGSLELHSDLPDHLVSAGKQTKEKGQMVSMQSPSAAAIVVWDSLFSRPYVRLVKVAEGLFCELTCSPMWLCVASLFIDRVWCGLTYMWLNCLLCTLASPKTKKQACEDLFKLLRFDYV